MLYGGALIVNASVERAAREDLPELLTLLKANGLPPDGLEEHLLCTLVARKAGRVVGSAAVEMYGAYALLRSVAVDEGHRGDDLGQHLTRGVLRLARERGAVEAFLLTEAADGFFFRLGFEPVERPAVPEEVRGSVEFVSACPESARAMAADLRGIR